MIFIDVLFFVDWCLWAEGKMLVCIVAVLILCMLVPADGRLLLCSIYV